MSAERLARMDSIIRESIEKKELPGAVVLVARHGRVVWRKAYGARAVEPQREAMTTDGSLFEATVDVEGLKTGDFQLPVTVVAPARVGVVRLEPADVKVRIR